VAITGEDLFGSASDRQSLDDIIARRALVGRIASLSQVARYLGHNRSSLSELVSPCH